MNRDEAITAAQQRIAGALEAAGKGELGTMLEYEFSFSVNQNGEEFQVYRRKSGKEISTPAIVDVWAGTGMDDEGDPRFRDVDEVIAALVFLADQMAADRERFSITMNEQFLEHQAEDYNVGGTD